MSEGKKKWVEPELIGLVRSRPEEAVLETCKGGESIGSSYLEAGCIDGGVDCSAITSS